MQAVCGNVAKSLQQLANALTGVGGNSFANELGFWHEFRLGENPSTKQRGVALANCHYDGKAKPYPGRRRCGYAS